MWRLLASNMDAANIRGHDAFICKGFGDWKHAVSTDRGFTKHNVSDLHQTCTETLANRPHQRDNSAGHPAMAGGLNERQLQREKELSENRKYIGRLTAVMQFLMRLPDLAFRGHRESEDSLHRGNFRELVKLLRNTDNLF
jgi:Domain of unknown function (DUF4371)